MSDKNTVVAVAELEHLHQRINIMQDVVSGLAGLVIEAVSSKNPTDGEALTSDFEVRMTRIFETAEKRSMSIQDAFTQQRLAGMGLTTQMRSIAFYADGFDTNLSIPFYSEEECAKIESVLEWNNYLVSNSFGLIDVEGDDDSPFKKALASIDFGALTTTRYEDTASGIYRYPVDDYVAYLTILRIERDGEPKHFIIIPFGTGRVEIRSYVPNERVWLSHSNLAVIEEDEVCQSIFDLLNAPNRVNPPSVSLNAAATVVENTLRNREPGPYHQSIRETYNEAESVRTLVFTTPRFEFVFTTNSAGDEDRHTIDLVSEHGIQWAQLHPLMQQQIVRDFTRQLAVGPEETPTAMEAANDQEVAEEEAS